MPIGKLLTGILYDIDAYKHIDALPIGKLLIGISHAIDVYKHINAQGPYRKNAYREIAYKGNYIQRKPSSPQALTLWWAYGVACLIFTASDWGSNPGRGGKIS